MFQDETLRDILNRRYGKEEAERIIKSIRDRDAANVPEEILAANNFMIPDYSDKNLDRPIKVTAVSQEKLGNPTWAGQAYPVGNKEATERGDIRINIDTLDTSTVQGIEDEMTMNKPPDIFSGTSQEKSIYDLLGHEATHTAQSSRNTTVNRNWPKINPSDSNERAKGKQYSQDPYEPAARMSEMKHAFFKDTGIGLGADATPDQMIKFKNWYMDFYRGKNPYMDDTYEILNSPEGEELFRRVAKKDQTNNGEMVA